VKLLFDANLSRRIVGMLEDLFPGSQQVTLLGLSGETPDEVIWEAAREGGFTIVSADNDFVCLSARHGAPPKVIWLERMDYSTQEAASLIRRNAVLISQFEKSERRVLVLRRA
jgi:predicted nuclease of predicted toxin-antitoxin system